MDRGEAHLCVLVAQRVARVGVAKLVHCADIARRKLVYIKKPANPLQLQQILHSLLNMKEDIDKDYIKFFRTNKITFTCLGDETVSWTRDGEYGGNSRVNTIFNYNKAVSFIVGKEGSPNLSDKEEFERDYNGIYTLDYDTEFLN